MSHRPFSHLSSRLFLASAASFLMLAAGALVADEVTVIEKHNAKIMISGDGAPEIFHVDESDLEVGESRQFFTDDGREIVILRTEEGFDLTMDGESVGLGDIGMEVIHLGGDHDSHSGVSHFKIHDGESGHKMVFVSTGDDDHDSEHEMVWVGSGKAYAHAFTTGADRKGALEHLKSSGALDNLDEESREKIIDALRAFEDKAQNP